MSGVWRTISSIAAAVSAFLCLALAVCYLFRPDACAAATVVPIWYWLPVALILIIFSWRGRRRLVMLLWLAFFLGFAEEPKSVARGMLPAPRVQAATKSADRVRLITFNCAGTAKAAERVVPLHPDLVVLQECPSRRRVKALATQLFGNKAQVLVHADSAILYGGALEREPPPFRYSARARLTLPSGRHLTVVSVHLTPASADLSLWSRETWAAQARNRRRRRAQMETLAQGLAGIPEDEPTVLVGDFNAPAGDAVFRLLPHRLHDSFRRAGRGWGDTWMTALPLVRIDQVWVSDPLRPLRVIASSAPPSDHRMVVCDVVLGR